MLLHTDLIDNIFTDPGSELIDNNNELVHVAVYLERH